MRFWLRKVFLKKAGAALVPSTLQRCRSNRDFRAVRAEISVLSRMKSLHSLEISAGSGCSVPREKQPASSVFEASSLFWVLALAPACWVPAFLRDALLARSCPKPVLMQINSRKLPGLTQAVRLRKGKFDLQKTSKIQIE